MAKQTCLYKAHKDLMAKMVDFAGFDMPIQYEGILQEHEATRKAVGLYDVSHMGKFYLKGSHAESTINRLVTNDITTICDGQAIYSPMCYENGGTIDDILVYRLSADNYLMVVNASNREKDYKWVEDHLEGDTTLEDATDGMCQIAVQGPKAATLVQSLVDGPIDDIRYYWFRENINIGGTPVLLSRTGYTGEDGFELYFSAEDAIKIWELLLDRGGPYGIKPCGLGARDTLRFEAGMPLYGNELGEDINPLETGLSYFVKLDKEPFIGQEALAAYKAAPKRKLVGIKLLDKGIARHGTDVVGASGDVIGTVTTGYKSPTFGDTLGFALIPADYSEETVYLQMRKKQIQARIINKRFLKTYNMEV